MMRNEEEYPNFDFSIQNLNKGSFIYISLSYFLWTIKNERLYNGPYHVWEYLEESELSLALHDAFSATIKYGLPWLENPKSK